MTEMDKLFNHKPTPPKSIIDILGNHDKLIDITVWYDYNPGYTISYRYILALFILIVAKIILKKRAS